MQSARNKAGVTVAGMALVSGAMVAAAPASWAAQSLQPVKCAGQQLTVRVNNNNSSDHGGWGAAIVVSGGSGHLIPTVISGSLYDVTAGMTVFTFQQAKGGGHANHKQQTVTCTDTQTTTLGEFAGPGEALPPGTSPTDTVMFTLTVTAIRKG
jgi:hypothetical protein